MVQICEGHKTKGDMLIENIERYKEMYMRTKQDFGRIAAVSSLILHILLPSTTDLTQPCFAERGKSSARQRNRL